MKAVDWRNMADLREEVSDGRVEKSHLKEAGHERIEERTHQRRHVMMGLGRMNGGEGVFG